MNDVIGRMVRKRRRRLLRDDEDVCPPDDTDVWGLALSGGGIRSATFCFGLLCALARSRQLLRFDLLSTVSGGGYIGSMLGRLLSRATTAADRSSVLAALGRGNTAWFSEWLRANGRYLTPSGVSDRLVAGAVYLRNLISVHAELGVLGLMLGIVLSGIDLLAWWSLDWSVGRWPGLETLPVWREWIEWIPTAWLLLVVAVAVVVVLALAYQAIPALCVHPASGWAIFTIALIATTGLLAAHDALTGSKAAIGWGAREFLVDFGIALAAGWCAGVAVAWYAMHFTVVKSEDDGRQTVLVDAVRSRLTKWLANVVRLAMLVVLLGCIDRAGWWLAFARPSWENSGLLLAGAAAVARALLPALQSSVPNGGVNRFSLALASIAGRLLTFLLAVWWVAVVHRTVMSALFSVDGTSFLAPLPFLGAMLALAATYIIGTGWDVQFLNLFSLHPFYRARLVRSYLGAGNPDRFPAPGGGAPDAMNATRDAVRGIADAPLKTVSDVHPDDDIDIHSYCPQRIGGPVHLINVCVNETQSKSGGLFNQDRRGRLLTVASGGAVRLGQRDWRLLQRSRSASSLTLGSWMAISGAALSTAMGGRTRGGIPALAMFAGARLGYWWDSSAISLPAAPQARQPSLLNRIFANRLFAKSGGLARETLGQFTIDDGGRWYLSDGGHFENTGAYALLAERCRLIVVADCGADPSYQFDDLENLVRKARIDLKCEIEFLRPRLHDPLVRNEGGTALADYGSLNDLASNESQSCLALAKVRYLDASPMTGHLVLVKPNLCAGLPVDLFNFKQEQPEFPQQPTADQFFDEAQWESYFQLGLALGGKLSKRRLQAVLAHADDWFESDIGSPLAAPAAPAASAKAAAGAAATADAAVATKPASTSRLPARLAGTAVRASLSLGAVAAVAFSAWQGISAARDSYARKESDDRVALKEMTDLWARLPPPTAPQSASAAGALAAAIARVSDTACSSGNADWFNRSPLAVDVLAAARSACALLDRKDQPPSCVWLRYASDPASVWPRATCLKVGTTIAEQQREEDACAAYWGRDYTLQAPAHCAPPAFMSTLAKQELEKERRDRYVVAAARSPIGKPDAWGRNAPVCWGFRVRPTTYSAQRKSEADELALAWALLGADVMATEDAVERAFERGRAPPALGRPSGISYSDTAAKACAEAMCEAAWTPSERAARDPNERCNKIPAQFVPDPEHGATRIIDVWLTRSDQAGAAEELRTRTLGGGGGPAVPEGPAPVKDSVPVVPPPPGLPGSVPSSGCPAVCPTCARCPEPPMEPRRPDPQPQPQPKTRIIRVPVAVAPSCPVGTALVCSGPPKLQIAQPGAQPAASSSER